MPLQGTVGELRKSGDALKIEWQIADVFSLPYEVDKYYDSPPFYSADAIWYFRIYLSGESRHNSEGYVGIYVMRKDSGPRKDVLCDIFHKSADGTKHMLVAQMSSVYGNDDRLGIGRAFVRSSLLERQSTFAPSGVLTIVCSLKIEDTEVLENSLMRRLHNVGINMKKILIKGKRSDVVLRVGGREFSAHKMILESRSSVFSAMFEHDMEEKRTGVVNIEDIHPDIFEAALSYMYSGEVDNLSYDNAFQIYHAADKYDLIELKQLCRRFVERNMTEKTVCDVIKFADFYKEDELNSVARKYFIRIYDVVARTNRWKIFTRENRKLAFDLIHSLPLSSCELQAQLNICGFAEENSQI